MHTVFVNASENTVGGRLDVLGMEKEFKNVIMMNSPLSHWFDRDGGFDQCALQLGEMIDSFQEINNRFNLIVYVDLLSIREYAAVFYNNSDVILQNVTYELIRAAVTRLMVDTLYSRLEALGRTPNGKMLLLLEQNKRRDEGRGNEILGKDLHTLKEKAKAEIFLRLLGLPSVEELEQKLRQTLPEEREAVLSAIVEQSNAGLKWLKPAVLYRDQLRTFVKSIVEDRTPVQQAAYELVASVEKGFAADSNADVVISEYVTDRRSGYTNKEIESKRNLLIQCFLLDCISSESIYDMNGSETVAKQVPKPTEKVWAAIGQRLAVKKRTYEKESVEVQRLNSDFGELGLAPELLKLPWEMFGLDETGNIRRRIVISANPGKDKKNQNLSPETDPKKKDEDEVLVDREGCVVNWLPGQGLEFTDEDLPVEQKKGDHRQNALTMANEHLSFLRNLSLKISRAVANYAGSSLSNKPAILRKRYVSAGNEEGYDVGKDYKYSPGLKVAETAPVETVRDTSKRAYITLMTEYLKFNASRSVSVSTVRDQCEHFVNRVRQIKDSMNKLVSMLAVLAVVLLFAYLPFVLLQWEAITENVWTVLVAIVSLMIPFALLGIGYGVARVMHKQKIRDAWEELQDLSNTAGDKNGKAAQAFSELLRRYIPSLRWCYEYVLDVDFYCDCCRVARAKLQHHWQKLQECREIVDNLLEDLEFDPISTADPEDYEIDYTGAYCEEPNRDYYSVMDEKMLDMIQNGKGEQ